MALDTLAHGHTVSSVHILNVIPIYFAAGGGRRGDIEG